MKYDLLLKGGEVIDPAQGIHSLRDVAFRDGNVAAVETHVAEADALEVYSATDQLVLPGLVDSHAHFFWGVLNWLYPPADFLSFGVTCAAEAGTAGCVNYYNLRDYIIRPAALHLYAYLSLAPTGLLGGGEELAKNALGATVGPTIDELGQQL
jgi:dihydroorotase